SAGGPREQGGDAENGCVRLAGGEATHRGDLQPAERPVACRAGPQPACPLQPVGPKPERDRHRGAAAVPRPADVPAVRLTMGEAGRLQRIDRPLEGLTVLVVEDNPDGAELLRQMTTGAGARAMVARNGLEGLRVFRAQRSDVVLADLRMPGMDG